MPAMKEGDIILIPLPQADGRTKLRPALLLREMPAFKDFLVCGISTKLHHRIEHFDEIIAKEDSDFKQSGLIQPSLVRLGFLAIVPLNHIAGSIGNISSRRYQQLLQNLSHYLTKK